MIRIYPLLALTANTLSLLVTTNGLTQENQLSGNSTFFTGEPPRLVSTDTPYKWIDYPTPKYFFTINLPQDSVESLGKVTIHPQESGDPIQFNLSNTKAFQGTHHDRGQALTLKEVTQDSQTQTISITFSPPVPPGTTLNISLQARQNPSVGGVYLFRVRAFPAGENPSGLDLGVGRLEFYERN